MAGMLRPSLCGLEEAITRHEYDTGGPERKSLRYGGLTIWGHAWHPRYGLILYVGPGEALPTDSINARDLAW